MDDMRKKDDEELRRATLYCKAVRVLNKEQLADCTEEEALLLIDTVLSMTTINAVHKDGLLHAMRWLRGKYADEVKA